MRHHVATQTEAPASLDDVARRELGDRFDLGAILSADTHSILYLAEERETRGPLRLRVFALAPLREVGLAGRLQNVLAAVTALDHPHLLPVYRAGSTSALLWAATPHVDGRTLARALAFGGPLSVDACARLVRQLAAGLQYLHGRGLVHGAVTPLDIVIGEDDRARLTDIGLERLVGDLEGFHDETWRHHPAYTAPEAAMVSSPAATEDQYGLAVTICECLTGPWPPEGNGLAAGAGGEALVAHVVQVRRDLPPTLRVALRRALSPRPTDRFPGIREFVAALDGGTAPPAAVSPPRAETPDAVSPHVILVKGSQRRAMVRAATRTTLVLAVGALGAMQLFRGAPALPRLAPAVVVAPGPNENSRFVSPGMVRLPPRPEPTPASVRPPVDTSQADTSGVDVTIASDDTTAVVEPPDAPPRRRAGDNDPPPPPPRPPPPPPGGRAGDNETAPRTPRRAPLPTVTDTPLPGRLFISSRPWGQLHVDGQLVGTTPVSSFPIAAGRHRLRITRDGFAPWEREVVVEPGSDVRQIDIILRRINP